MNKMNCPACGSNLIEYLGADDGGGDYGDSICDEFRCHDCATDFEANCLDTIADALPDDVCLQCFTENVRFMCGNTCSKCYADYYDVPLWIVRLNHIVPGFVIENTYTRIRTAITGIMPSPKNDDPVDDIPF